MGACMLNRWGFLALTLAGFAGQAHASVVQIQQSAFTPAAGEITFSEYPQGTQNPVYLPATYGGGAGSPTVTFGGYFLGQMAGGSNPSACPSGAAVSGCVLGNPTGPLTIDPTSPSTFITGDGAMPTSPILSGSPLYNGSIAIKFSTPQSAVGLTGGYFDAVGSTGITVYDAAGKVLGSVSNDKTGDEFLGLATSDKSAQISGLLFHLVGDEPFGFDVDNIQFGVGGQIVLPSVPLPATLPMFGAGLAMFGLFGYGFKKKRSVSAA